MEGSFGAPVLTLGVILTPPSYTLLVWGIPEREMRRCRAETRYELEALFAEAGWYSEELIYDEEHDLYRFADGEYANERPLREMGFIG